MEAVVRARRSRRLPVVLSREGKGSNARCTILPRSLIEPLQREVEHARCLHQGELAEGFGAARLPHTQARKDPELLLP